MSFPRAGGGLGARCRAKAAKGEGENWKKLTVRWTGCPGAQLMILAKKEDGEQRGKLGAYGARMKALTSRWGARRGPAEAEAPED